MRLSALTVTLACTIGLFAGAVAEAQNAQITGTVKDTSGAVVPGVSVSAHNADTGLVRTDVTDSVGDYRLGALPPGIYSVTSELVGFTSETRPNITLVIEQNAVINFVMKPATVSETVTVSGESPIVDTSRSDVATSVSTAQIQDLPVASRRWIDLALLAPGVSKDNIRGQFYLGTVNIGAGTREYSNMYVVDGVNNTWQEMGEPRQNFAMDSIQEFKVSTSTFKAEYGLATGGVLTVFSKSGTNQFHGSGLLFVRDASMTAREYFQVTKPPYSRDQFGGTFGGPIVKDRTHFFFAYERTNEKPYLTVNTHGIWPQYDGTYLSDQYRWTWTAKVDHQLSPSQSLFIRYAGENEYRPIVNAGGTIAPSGAFDFSVPRSSLAVGHTWVISNRALNDFHFQYAYADSEVAMPYSHGEWAAGDFSAAKLALCTPQYNYPSLSLGSCNSQMGPEWRWEFKDEFSYLMHGWGGRHQWKAGFDFSPIDFAHDSTGGYDGAWTFPKDTPYNPNDKTTWPTQYSQSLPSYADIPVKNYAWYVQDDWEPASHVVLNLGLRWDMQQGAFNENIPDLLSRIGTKLGPQFAQFPIPVPFIDTSIRGDRNNFGPRVGFAWSPGDTGATNIHAGTGVFYDNIRHLLNFTELTWPQAQTIIISNPSYPDPLQGKTRDAFLSTAPPNISVISNRLVNPYAYQYNAGLTQMLTRNIALSADFTWVQRYSDQDVVDQNLPDPVTGIRPYPQFARVPERTPTSNNTYKALLVKVEKRLSNRYQFLASYTLSKADDSAIRNVLGTVYGYSRVDSASVADRRHRLVTSGIVQLPYEFQLSAIGDFRSSLAFFPTTSLDLNHDGYTGDLPAGVAYGSGCRSLNLDAINAFRTSRGLAAIPSGGVTCSAFSNVDLRLSKTLAIGGTHRVELIAQLFNVFNHANFATPINNLTSSAFGQVTQLQPYINAPSRQVEVAVRYQF
jgi:carboxypeptidase family protein